MKRLIRRPARRPEPDRPLEGAPTLGDQMISGIADALGFRGIDRSGRRDARRLERAIGDFEFRERRAPGQLLDRAAVEIARRKIHVGKVAAARSRSSTRLTLSNSSAQSMSEISRMLVMMLRTVTLDAPCRCWACCTTSSIEAP